MGIMKSAYHILFRNSLLRDGTRAAKNCINLEYYTSNINLGDALAPIIFEWMLAQKNILTEKRVQRTGHLLTVGSLLGGSGLFDASVWGTGIRSYEGVCSIGKRRHLQKLDIRAVRGPITRQVLRTFGYECPEIYGDPAVLMPLIYNPPRKSSSNMRIGLIQHYLSHEQVPPELESINIQTDDYQDVIAQIVKCDKIISSSLHGIILAESYGIPAVLLGKSRESELLKYYDWYYSTGRYSVKIAMSLEEAMEMEPMEIPDLHFMQEKLLQTFPYDLWQ